jgi:DNA polymerase-3 subunit gamma/tau
MEALAIKYRPKTFEDVTEQESIKIILKQQLETGTIKNAYLFCGGAGTGKTTCARIFANEINKGKGNPIEMDAASNSGVEDVRNITHQAKLKSLDSDYKIFIIDECHAISNTGWQAFLKLIEEPPKNTIFIFATTDPQKIPKTILSRVQRYDFRRISQQGIADRLDYILSQEMSDDMTADRDAVEYLAKLADGGMRDAITMMDKCLSYTTNLTIENVVKALGTVDYESMKQLTDSIIAGHPLKAVQVVEELYNSGKDIKQFINMYTQFLLDVQKYKLTEDFKYTQFPGTDDNIEWFKTLDKYDYELCFDLLSNMVKLNSAVKWSQTPKYDLEAELLLFAMEDGE